MTDRWKTGAGVRSSETPIGWTCEGLRFRYAGAAAAAIDGVSAEIPAYRCTALLGPNGSGKSTLLRLLVGIARPEGGSARLGGRDLANWSRRELARVVGVVPQSEEVAFPLSVREMVSMGRYPHLGALKPAGWADREAVEEAMQMCDVAQFASRDLATLSGGERQRVRLARALAQQPAALVLDEPTLALDVRHEMLIFELVRELTRASVTVILVTHNINLAARYADRLLLLDRGHLVAAGSPLEVLQRDRLERVYGWPLLTTRFEGPGPDAGAVQITPLARDVGDRADATDSSPTPGRSDHG
ncbi:MAG: ATP-binding cassette domain-containing protein [Gemmatimonas sp.]|nr:ATP-binding cassette domain-containing protein [Gemmatimonas sp.]